MFIKSSAELARVCNACQIVRYNKPTRYKRARAINFTNH